MSDGDRGVTMEAPICLNGHGDSGQVMESRELPGYECPECGRTARYTIRWYDD